MGDGVLAYFGYPRAHEDDAERAVRAGLALVGVSAKLHAGSETPLQMRVGIAASVVVGCPKSAIELERMRAGRATRWLPSSRWWTRGSSDDRRRGHLDCQQLSTSTR
jgi:hypothetical protein